MSFLTLNGWRVDVASGSASGRRNAHGAIGEAWTNRPGRFMRGHPREWSLTTKQIAPPCADTLEAMLDGRGHHIPLNGSLYSTAGLVPQGGLGTFTFPERVAERPVFGRAHLSLTAGSIIWNPGFIDGKWTVLYWRYADLGPGYGGAQHIAVRADGAKWEDGVRNDAATTSELTVSNGAASFGAEEYDDIVLLPYAACDEMIEAAYLWTTAHALSAHIPMRDLGREMVNGQVATVTGTVAFDEGRVSGSADFQDATARLAYGTSALFDIASAGDETGFAVEVWINLDTLAAIAVVLDHRTAGNGWTLQVTAAGKVDFFATRATTDTEALTADGAVAVDGWTHVAASMDPTTLRASIYVNGVLQTLTTDDQGVGALDSDTAATLYVGNNSGSTNAVDGEVSDVRIFQRAATAAEVLERYRCGASAREAPSRQPFSDLPYLSLSGDVIDCDEVEVIGRAEESSIVQHGGAAWVNNAREVSGTLEERKHRERRTLSPDVGYVLDSRYLTAATTVRAAHGPHTGTLQNGVTADGRAGPFGLGQSFNFDDTASERILLTTDERDGITGARAATVSAWVRRVASNDQDVILSYGLADGTSLFQFDVTNATGELRIGARSRSGETFRNLTVAAAVDDEWRHVAGVADLAGGELFLYVDGERVGSGSATWDQPRFSGEAFGSSYIGAHPGGSLSFDGDIASVGVWYRRLRPEEVRTIFLRGIDGVFR